MKNLNSFKTELFHVQFTNAEHKSGRSVTITKLNSELYEEIDSKMGMPAVVRFVEDQINFQITPKEAIKIYSTCAELFYSK
jgi:hypothetical protein